MSTFVVSLSISHARVHTYVCEAEANNVRYSTCGRLNVLLHAPRIVSVEAHIKAGCAAPRAQRRRLDINRRHVRTLHHAPIVVRVYVSRCAEDTPLYTQAWEAGSHHSVQRLRVRSVLQSPMRPDARPCAPSVCDPTTMHFQTLTQCTFNYCSPPGDRSVTVWHFHRTSNTFQPWAAVPACARARMLSCKPLHLDPRTRMLADRVTMRLERCSWCPALMSNALCMRAVRQRVGPTQWGWRR